MRHSSKVLCLFGVIAGLAGAADASDLFCDGKSDWKIAYEVEGDDSPIAYGAGELQRAIEKISGVTLPSGLGKSGKATVYIGVDPTLPKSDDEIVVIRLKGESIELVGNQPRAALHAVYQFLCRELGVRWLWTTESGEFMPKRTRWSVPSRPEWRHTPSIRYRGFHICGDWFQREDFVVWMARNCASAQRHGEYNKGDHRFGFHHYLTVTLDSVSHKHFKSHPECFCEINGKRLPNNVCFSSELCAELSAQELVATIRNRKKHPIEILQFFLADNQDYCKCEKCRKMSVSEGFFSFFNRTADLVRKECPDVKLATLAYQQYCPAPSFPVRAEFVEYATHSRCNFHLLDAATCSRNAHEQAALDDWGKVGVPLGEYAYNFDAFWTRDVWLPIFHLIDEQIENAVRRRFVSLIGEVGTSPRNGPEENVSSCYNRLPELYYAWKMWDASLTFDAFLDDVTKTAYGPAAEPMKRYFKLMDAAWGKDPNHHVGILTDGLTHIRKMLPPELKEAALKALADAATLIGSATAQQKAAFRREEVNFRRWTDLLDLANGTAAIVRLPQIAGARTAEAGACNRLMTKGQPSGATVRAVWTDDALVVDFAGCAADVKAAEVRLQEPTTGHRYSYRLARNGDHSQTHISEVGIADSHYAPQWTGAFAKDEARFTIPVVAFATPPVKAGLKMGVHFSLEGVAQADYPARADVNAELRFTSLVQVDVPALFYENARTAMPPVKARVLMADSGFRPTCTTNLAEAAQLVEPNQRVFWFRNMEFSKVDAKLAASVREAVHDKGAVALFTSYWPMDLVSFLKDESCACKLTMPASLPLPLRVPTSITEGPWMKEPYDLTRSLRGLTPCYAQEPLHPELWMVCCRQKAEKEGEVPFLAYRPFGKGIIAIGGESLPISQFRLLTNLQRLQSSNASAKEK